MPTRPAAGPAPPLSFPLKGLFKEATEGQGVTRPQRLPRLLRVLAAVIAEPGLNPLELADRAGVSDRTLRRDLNQLRELGYEVEYTSGYEVQEKLNLEGRPAGRRPKRAHE